MKYYLLLILYSIINTAYADILTPTIAKHGMVVKNPMGAAASILIDNNMLYGANDPRRQGIALGY
jgi:gamma-glutamyltranspeptidase